MTPIEALAALAAMIVPVAARKLQLQGSSVPAIVNVPNTTGAFPGGAILPGLIDRVQENSTLFQGILPPYVDPDSWQPYNSSEPCPAGYTCTKVGKAALGAFSCDEMARIAVEVYGFGDVLAGIFCPEGENDVLNCRVGGYCPNSTTRIECPNGRFCPYKTKEDSHSGGSHQCKRCEAGATQRRLSREEVIAEIVVLVVLCLLVIFVIARRRIRISKEKMKQVLHLEQLKRNMSDRTEHMQAVKREQEKYGRLRPKLEVIADRLSKIRDGIDPQDPTERSSPNPTKQHTSGSDVTNDLMTMDSTESSHVGTLSKRKSVLYLGKSGDIIFNADELFDILDKDKNGFLSYSEINKVLCLSDEQLRGFISDMRNRMTTSFRAPEGQVSRAVFVSNFLDALADASQLEPTPEEVEALFHHIAEEVGTTDSGEIVIEKLYSSFLSSFLPDWQIYEIIRRFKQREVKSSSIRNGVSKDMFVELYPIFLAEVTHPEFKGSSNKKSEEVTRAEGGLDVAFEHLCLAVKVGGNEVNVVDDVTGRLRSGTMTAVMGGSGSGKSSLLNALCGRAFYGKVTGNVKINGNDSLIEDHKPVIGFVPQDDIVYPDMTVRENLIYAGRLQLPAGTTGRDIAELADATMASLGLSRIANSLVGDATRRGISGGEKKRVNVGIELMKKPKILFLDEPTSGLDSRSAFIVMDSLKRLVMLQGMTVASVIHQPRTDIYDMFDSLFLLGVGGRTVFSGPATEAKSYFENLGFQMRPGESQADWFLDISSGDIEAENIEAGRMNNGEVDKTPLQRKPAQTMRFEVAIHIQNGHIGFDLGQPRGDQRGNFVVTEVGKIEYATTFLRGQNNYVQVGDKVVGINGNGVGQMTHEDVEALLKDQSAVVFVELMRQEEMQSVVEAEEDHNSDEQALFLISNENHGKVANEDGALLKAREAREKLFRQFQIHFDNLDQSQKERIYEPPTAYALPQPPKAVPIWSQLIVQLRRNCLLTRRNLDSKVIDFGILFVAIYAITLLAGANAQNYNNDPRQLLWVKFTASKEDASVMLQPVVFRYALSGVSQVSVYAMMVGLIMSVLIALPASKIITDKKLEFYREAQSGISVNAFYMAAVITTTIEQGIAAIVGSLLAFLVLIPSNTYLGFLANFILLSWLTVSWALLIAVTVPLDSVKTVCGFFFAFFGLLFCGKVAPGEFHNIYKSPALAVFSGFFSPLRFFVEGLGVNAARCLPVQSGFPVASNALNFQEFQKSYSYWFSGTYMGHTDLSTVTVQSCKGWYWWVPAAFVIGITVHIAGGISINTAGRSKQGKKSVLKEVRDDLHKCRSGGKPLYRSFVLRSLLTVTVFVGFVTLSSWLILRKNPDSVSAGFE